MRFVNYIHCNADASNLSLITTFMEMGPRTKFIWSYETPICFLQSCDHSTVLYFATTICLSLVHWKISSSHIYTTLATVEASWSFIKHSRHFWQMPVSDWSTVFYLSSTHNSHFLLKGRITLLFYYIRGIVLKKTL